MEKPSIPPSEFNVLANQRAQEKLPDILESIKQEWDRYIQEQTNNLQPGDTYNAEFKRIWQLEELFRKLEQQGNLGDLMRILPKEIKEQVATQFRGDIGRRDNPTNNQESPSRLSLLKSVLGHFNRDRSDDKKNHRERHEHTKQRMRQGLEGEVELYPLDYLIGHKQARAGEDMQENSQWIRQGRIDAEAIRGTTENRRTIRPADLYNLVRCQSYPEQAITELIANAKDASSTERPIGRFGIGFLSSLQWLRTRTDRVSIYSKREGTDGIYSQIASDGHDYRVGAKKSEDFQKVARQTIQQFNEPIKPRRNLTGTVMRIETKLAENQQKAFLAEIEKRFAGTRGATIKVLYDGQVQNVNGLHNLQTSTGEVVSHDQSTVYVSIHDDGFEILDLGVGIDGQVLYESLLIPHHSARDRQTVRDVPTSIHKMPATEMFIAPEGTETGVAPNTPKHIHLQVGDMNIESYEMDPNRFNLPHELILSLPTDIPRNQSRTIVEKGVVFQASLEQAILQLRDNTQLSITDKLTYCNALMELLVRLVDTGGVNNAQARHADSLISTLRETTEALLTAAEYKNHVVLPNIPPWNKIKTEGDRPSVYIHEGLTRSDEPQFEARFISEFSGYPQGEVTRCASIEFKTVPGLYCPPYFIHDGTLYLDRTLYERHKGSPEGIALLNLLVNPCDTHYRNQNEKPIPVGIFRLPAQNDTQPQTSQVIQSSHVEKKNKATGERTGSSQEKTDALIRRINAYMQNPGEDKMNEIVRTLGKEDYDFSDERLYQLFTDTLLPLIQKGIDDTDIGVRSLTQGAIDSALSNPAYNFSDERLYQSFTNTFLPLLKNGMNDEDDVVRRWAQGAIDSALSNPAYNFSDERLYQSFTNTLLPLIQKGIDDTGGNVRGLTQKAIKSALSNPTYDFSDERLYHLFTNTLLPLLKTGMHDEDDFVKNNTYETIGSALQNPSLYSSNLVVPIYFLATTYFGYISNITHFGRQETDMNNLPDNLASLLEISKEELFSFVSIGSVYYPEVLPLETIESISPTTLNRMKETLNQYKVQGGFNQRTYLENLLSVIAKFDKRQADQTPEQPPKTLFSYLETSPLYHGMLAHGITEPEDFEIFDELLGNGSDLTEKEQTNICLTYQLLKGKSRNQRSLLSNLISIRNTAMGAVLFTEVEDLKNGIIENYSPQTQKLIATLYEQGRQLPVRPPENISELDKPFLLSSLLFYHARGQHERIDITDQQRAVHQKTIEHATNSQNARPDTWVRELLQNARDAMRRHYKDAQANMPSIVVQTQRTADDVMVVSIRDTAGGMNYKDIATKLLLPHVRDPQKVADTSQAGGFGWGFWTVFDRADAVELKTTKDFNTINMKLVPLRRPNGDVYDIEVRHSQIKSTPEEPSGTTISVAMRNENHLPSGLQALDVENALDLYAKPLAHGQPISYNGEAIAPLQQYTLNTLRYNGDHIIVRRTKHKSDGYQRITQHDLYLGQLDENTFNLLKYVPRPIQTMLRRQGIDFQVDIPASIPISADRSTIVLSDQEQDCIRKIIAVQIIQEVAKMYKDGELPLSFMPDDALYSLNYINDNPTVSAWTKAMTNFTQDDSDPQLLDKLFDKAIPTQVADLYHLIMQTPLPDASGETIATLRKKIQNNDESVKGQVPEDILIMARNFCKRARSFDQLSKQDQLLTPDELQEYTQALELMQSIAATVIGEQVAQRLQITIASLQAGKTAWQRKSNGDTILGMPLSSAARENLKASQAKWSREAWHELIDLTVHEIVHHCIDNDGIQFDRLQPVFELLGMQTGNSSDQHTFRQMLGASEFGGLYFPTHTAAENTPFAFVYKRLTEILMRKDWIHQQILPN